MVREELEEEVVVVLTAVLDELALVVVSVKEVDLQDLVVELKEE